MRSAWRALLAAGRLPPPPRLPRPRPLLALRHLSSAPPSLAEVVSRASPDGDVEDLRAKLVCFDPPFDHDALNSTLRTLSPSPDRARALFDWASSKTANKLRSQSYNLLLGSLACGGRSQEFWHLFEVMRKKGFGVSNVTFSAASQGFLDKGLEKDSMLVRLCKIFREKEDLGVAFKKKLDEFADKMSPDLAATMLMRARPSRWMADQFTTWIGETQITWFDRETLTQVENDLRSKYWSMVDIFTSTGVFWEGELTRERYIKISDKLIRTNKGGSSATQHLFEYAMASTEKPTARDLVLLLRKILSVQDTYSCSISSIVRTFLDGGGSLTGSVFHSVVKKLRNQGRLVECVKVLKAMENGGFVADGNTHDRVVVGLCDAGEKCYAFQTELTDSHSDDPSSLGETVEPDVRPGREFAFDYLECVEESGRDPGVKAWTSLIRRHCMSDELDKAAARFRKMVERRGAEKASCALEVLVNGFCSKDKAEDAFEILKEMVSSNKGLRPWHSTYKSLIEKLVSKGSLQEASALLGLMKGHRYPLYIDPFIAHVSKLGTVDDAFTFLKAMTVKAFPSKAVFWRLFEGLLKAGRHQVAHDLLSKSPGSVRNHADVLELFYSMKPVEAATAAAI